MDTLSLPQWKWSLFSRIWRPILQTIFHYYLLNYNNITINQLVLLLLLKRAATSKTCFSSENSKRKSVFWNSCFGALFLNYFGFEISAKLWIGLINKLLQNKNVRINWLFMAKKSKRRQNCKNIRKYKYFVIEYQD